MAKQELSIFERDYVEWIGRIAFQTQQTKIPDPIKESEEFNKWVDETLQLLDKYRENPPMQAPGAPLLGSWWSDNIVDPIVRAVTEPLKTMTTTINTIKSKVEDIPADIESLNDRFDPKRGLEQLGKDIAGKARYGIESIWYTPALMTSFVDLVIINNLNIIKELRGNQLAQTLIDYFQNADVRSRISNAIDDEIKTIIKDAESAGNVLKPLYDHFSVIRTLAEKEIIDYAERFAMAANSIEVILVKIDHGLVVFKDLLDLVTVLFSGKKKDGGKADVEEALKDTVVHLIVNMNPIVGIISRLMSGSLMQSLFPTGIGPGMMSRWINAEDGYEVLYSNDELLKSEERAFRRELVAAVDQYLHSESGNYGKLLRQADQRGAVEAFNDFVAVFGSTVFGFVFRRPGLPSPSMPKLAFANPFLKKVRADDVGSDLAASLSRLVVLPFKSVLGVVLNGVWAFSPNNRALVDTITGFITHLVRSLIEYLIHDLFWSFEIHETYKNGLLKEDLRITDWPAPDDLNYTLFKRHGILADTVTPDTLKKLLNDVPMLDDLLKDYAAYMEAVREYRRTGFGVVTDSIEAEIKPEKGPSGKNRLIVSATSEWKKIDNIPSIPVLRAYYNGDSFLLDPVGDNSNSSRKYTVQIECEGPCEELWIRSNYGGAFLASVSGE